MPHDNENVRSSSPGDTSVQPPKPKRRRIGQACASCRTRKSRCNGKRPRCGTCTELELTCEYASGQATRPSVAAGSNQLQAIENRLKSLESLLAQQHSKNPAASSETSPAVPGSEFGSNGNLDTPGYAENGTMDTVLNSPSEGPMGSTVDSEDPTDGMGHFVFVDEEERAFFGPSSSIAFTSDLSRAFGRLSRSREGLAASHGRPAFPELRIARVSRHASPTRRRSPSMNSGKNRSKSSIYYLPSDTETTTLIDKYFTNTGLLFPYIDEVKFRETYSQLKHNKQGIRRTWLGVLNMILAMAVYTSVLPTGKVAERQMQSEAFYNRARRLCEGLVMDGASLEIVQYLLLVSQYMQGTKSSIQTWAMHGLAVKVAMQLGLHSTEASKRFPPLEREIRKRTWFGCIVLDRSLSMTFGRPASIPESYSRLELPVYFDDIEPRQYPPKTLREARYSTDFFCSTIRLYSLMGNTIDGLYGGNLGCGDNILPYELIICIFKLRHQQDEWVNQLPPHIPLITVQDFWEHMSPDPTLDRFRIILTLRYHNLRILTHRVVLARLCKLMGEVTEESTRDIAGLNDVIGSTVDICIASSMEIIYIIYAIVQSSHGRRDMLGAWWFSLYYAFDAALVISTILLLLKQTRYVNLPPSTTQESLRHALSDAMGALRLLDEGNRTVDRCLSCLHKLVQVLDWMDSANGDQHNLDTVHSNPEMSFLDARERPRDTHVSVEQDAFTDHSISFLDFNFMADERLVFTDGFDGGSLM